ncbi:hypothetical protein KR51_00004690 [Rubidibacter lacunae KORDI 51-2]|uniref:SnoaL-like domain-containing protein n=1 Tax=Rubidibacter lacunae KORDI 51-2 TaxID=582515 RepID=U5DT39_9CHRO|nr:nuclear transport factor 2 family protein [Rubidibacter lacunae]ERN42850.1 hypothetical protein KR51_00004690 [Rubidibacter lacunae KORDI 51-2]
MVMTELAPLTQTEVRTFVTEWFRGLNDHQPLETVLSRLLPNSLVKYPEAELRGHDAFADWYRNTVLACYFDQTHEVQAIEIKLSPDGSQADLQLVVHWEAKTWESPAAFSTWLGYYSTHLWVVKRSPQTFKPAIESHIVHLITPMEGSAGISGANT